jgi:hypothetical protein
MVINNMIEPHRTVKSVTPKHGATWVAKWLATMLIVVGLALWQVALPASAVSLAAMISLLLGILGWWWTAYAWNDRALQLTTAVMGFIVIMDLLQTWL